MDRISDTITSVFHIAIKDKRPTVCSSGDGAIIWSDTFGLGWRFGISYNLNDWFPKIRLYLDHNNSHTDQDKATVAVSLRDSPDKSANELKERVITIIDFGHGQPALLGSWPISDLALHPYVWLTLSSKAHFPQPVMDPLSSASSAIRQSMDSGDFVDTKFYVFSAKRPGKAAGNPRVVYANSASINLVLPKSTSKAKQVDGLAPAFLLNMTGDQHINEDSVLHDYDYEQDSDLDDDDEVGSSDNVERHLDSAPGKFGISSSDTATGSTHGNIPSGAQSEILVEPPAYSFSTCRIILVKGVAYKTWLSYIYFRYTGQVSFLPLKSAEGSSGSRSYGPSQPPSCSPKSMYRLAVKLGDQRLQDYAFRAIKEGLSKDNIVKEAFSWFTAQYPDITKHEIERVTEFRKLPEVLLALKAQLKVVSLGEKPWAHDVLVGIMEKLNA